MATNHSETHPLKPHNQTNIPLEFSSVNTLPDSHAWPESNTNNDGPTLSIPIIDLMDPNAMEQIGHACENWGAFQLKNHGVTLSVLEDIEVEAKRLFDLPMEQKVKALRSVDNPTGGYGTIYISSYFDKYMWHEGFTIKDSPENYAKKFWPNDYTRFCDVIENFKKQMEELVKKLVDMVFNILGISEEEKSIWFDSNHNTGTVHFNSYPFCPEPNRAMGMAPHTDTTIFTILHQVHINGLQILNEGVTKDNWVSVPFDPNTLIVHTGDILHILSNARFKTVTHRVIVNMTKHRYSIPYFYRPKMDCVLSPLVPNAEPRFRAVTMEEFVTIKEKNFGKQLSLIST